MPPPFAQIDVGEFAELIDRFPFTRTINSVHMHHTWRPNHTQYRGHETIVAMWRHHTQVNGWRDIAQHISIAPDGSIWLGRNWNLPPASASGHNGNDRAGPFMFETIGDFDIGKDPLQSEQRETVLSVICLVQRRFGLAPETLMFHNMMSSKTCPGSAIDYRTFLEELKAHPLRIDRSVAARAPTRDLPFSERFQARAGRLAQVIDMLMREVPAARGETADAEHEELTQLELSRQERGGREVSRGLTAKMLDALRPHLINLRGGQFSNEGLFSTSQEDVDALFGTHLEQALREVKAQNAQAKLRLLFYAHGGLVSESAGLRIAHKHNAWWRANGIYPVSFIWETGLWQTISDLLRKTQEQGQRSILSDFITDPIVEAALRVLPAQSIWSGMKHAAERSSAAGGGAHYAATKLKEFCDRHPQDVELHALGHSAGAIFLNHYLVACRSLRVPTFKGGYFLAPAIRIDTFLADLRPLLGDANGLDHVTVFTMRKQYELDDNCAGIYRKSLLYLVSASAEPERGAPLLGLEVSLRGNAETRALFGLGDAASNVGEVVWSTTDQEDGRSASRSASHGGFDDDPSTLGSVVRRVLDRADADPIVPYVPLVEEGERGADWAEQIDWPEALRIRRPPPVRTSPQSLESLRAPMMGGTVGRRRAVCIGINDYREKPLSGCVADAQAWANTLLSFGFETPTLLLDAAATRSAILGAMQDLIAGSRSGDVLVIQYSGHGTQLPDLDGDEARGDTPGLDEALCPVDFPDGAFVIDDDIAAICQGIPDGVNATFFFDCCHSGTATRLGVGSASGAPQRSDVRARFIVATPQMQAAHERFRNGLRSARGAPAARSTQREVLFAACRSSEVAWESNGHGDFTTHATRLLREGLSGYTNWVFQERVIQAFGANARQNPELHCDRAALDRPVLGAIEPTPAPLSASSNATSDALFAELEALIRRYRARGSPS